MAKVATLLKESVFEAYRSAIEGHVKESHYTDALEKLIDFCRDCCPERRREAVALYSRYSRVKTAERQGLAEAENINGIVQAILDMADEIVRTAHIRDELALDSIDANRPSETPADTAPERRLRAVYSAPTSPEGLARSDAPMTDRAGTEARRSSYSGLSEAEWGRRLAGRPLDHIRQVYLDMWRETRRRDDDTCVVRCRNLTKSFGRNSFSLSPVSFELIAGEITGVIGMNASGKTTLLRLLLGDISPTAGSLAYPSLAAERNDWLSIRNELAYVSQLPERWHGRLRLNLNYTAAAYGCVGSENDELVDWYVHRYGLKDYEDATWDRISGGYKIRFELVRALLTRPRLLLLDEPLAYLDIVTQQIFLADVRSIASSLDRPIAIVFTSQHLYEIEAIANKMIILDDGHCLYAGPIDHMPHLEEFRTYEVALLAEKREVLSALRPIGLVDIEVTMTSFLITFDKAADHSQVVSALISHFGDRLTYFRDITRSTRSLFRNKRDDIVRKPSPVAAR